MVYWVIKKNYSSKRIDFDYDSFFPLLLRNYREYGYGIKLVSAFICIVSIPYQNFLNTSTCFLNKNEGLHLNWVARRRLYSQISYPLYYCGFMKCRLILGYPSYSVRSNFIYRLATNFHTISQDVIRFDVLDNRIWLLLNMKMFC